MNNINISQSCCFLGHKEIIVNNLLIAKVKYIVEDLIINKNIDTFLFGSKSQFIELCLEIVSEFKEKYPYIRRIYIRAEYPYINESYRNYLSESYEDTYYPEKIINAGKSVYVERNYEMIDKSDYCVIYYNKSATDSYNRKSGTKIAYEYAKKKNKNIMVI